MKKLFLNLISITLLTVLTVPVMVLAATGPITGCNITHAEVTKFNSVCHDFVSSSTTDAWGMCCLLNSVYTVIDWIFFSLVAIVALFTIWGSYDILTAAGDPEKLKKGRERIMWAMAGLAVALLSRAIPTLVESLL